MSVFLFLLLGRLSATTDPFRFLLVGDSSGSVMQLSSRAIFEMSVTGRICIELRINW